MKANLAVVAVAAATGAYAQGGYYGNGQSVSYTTVTYDDCPSASMETLITVTEGVTVTYCPECEHMTTPAQPGHTTVYTTTYMSLCPTGLVPQTYTITESCTEPTPTWTPGPSHVPQGFTVTKKVCTVCGETPTTVTITEPCGCEAHEGTPVPQRPPQTPAMPTPPPECDGDDCGGSWTPSPPPEGCDGDDCGGSPMPPPEGCDGDSCGGSTPPVPTPPGRVPAQPPYPTPSNGGGCPGPMCKATGTMAPPSRIPYNNTTGITPAIPPVAPPKGAAAHNSIALLSTSLMAVIVAILAIAL
jgi:hypothetical protein